LCVVKFIWHISWPPKSEESNWGFLFCRNTFFLSLWPKWIESQNLIASIGYLCLILLYIHHQQVRIKCILLNLRYFFDVFNELIFYLIIKDIFRLIYISKQENSPLNLKVFLYINLVYSINFSCDDSKFKKLLDKILRYNLYYFLTCFFKWKLFRLEIYINSHYFMFNFYQIK